MINKKGTIRIKELIGIILLPFPAIIYFTTKSILNISTSRYLFFVSVIILGIILFLLKTDVVVVDRIIKEKLFSLTKEESK